MMKKAFTLIELLVVIAIIAILAAILFPVFAQAKVAAKKTAAISNQKQIGTSVLIYMADYDDTYPRNDDCQPGSALNPELNNEPFAPTGVGCTTSRYFYRMNHYSWQKWLMPYMKNLQIFEHPGRQKNAAQWEANGEIMGGFGLNATITGMLDTYNRAPGSRGRFRNSWLGGTQTAIPDVAQAMLLFEFGNPDINYVPGIADNATSEDESYLVYPPAIREFWARNLMQWDTCTAWDMNEISSEPDTRSTIGGGLTLGFTDGHAKFYSAGKFLSETPTYAEYIVGGSVPSSRMCGISSGTFAWDADVDLTVDYPMWGLGNN